MMSGSRLTTEEITEEEYLDTARIATRKVFETLKVSQYPQNEHQVDESI